MDGRKNRRKDGKMEGQTDRSYFTGGPKKGYSWFRSGDTVDLKILPSD